MNQLCVCRLQRESCVTFAILFNLKKKVFNLLRLKSEKGKRKEDCNYTSHFPPNCA